MSETMTQQSLKEYIKNVRRLQWFIYVIPIGGWFLKGSWKYVFPVIGDEEASFRCLALTMILAGVAAIAPWTIDNMKIKRVMLWVSCLLLVASVISYGYFSSKYTICVPTRNGNNRCVSIGYERQTQITNECAQEQGHRCSDTELVERAGPYEDRVRRLWSDESIDKIRRYESISYAAMVSLLNLFIGLLAKREQ